MPSPADTCTNRNHGYFIRHGIPCDCAITTVQVDGRLVDCTARRRGDLLGARQERITLAGRTSRQHRPELAPRLATVEAEIATIEAELLAGAS